MARRRRSPRTAVRRAVLGVGVLVLVAFVASVLFAGSPQRLPSGTTIAGFDVGGMEPAAATNALEHRYAAVEHQPVEFFAGGRTFRLNASQLGVRPDWAAAVRKAAEAGDGFAPLRGLKRVQTRLLGRDVEPRVRTYPSVLRYTVGRVAAAVDRPAIEAGLERRGLSIVSTPGRAGTVLDRGRASAVIVAALASFERDGPVRLPVVRAEQKVT